mmetsp:Transcript_34248/g.102572  ORF Transcript_34248/g.102572 Transcript_34248/m.102572 type:complete len:379 (-) Transcript_34248:284-1420(-)
MISPSFSSILLMNLPNSRYVSNRFRTTTPLDAPAFSFLRVSTPFLRLSARASNVDLYAPVGEGGSSFLSFCCFPSPDSSSQDGGAPSLTPAPTRNLAAWRRRSCLLEASAKAAVPPPPPWRSALAADTEPEPQSELVRHSVCVFHSGSDFCAPASSVARSSSSLFSSFPAPSSFTSACSSLSSLLPSLLSMSLATSGGCSSALALTSFSLLSTGSFSCSLASALLSSGGDSFVALFSSTAGMELAGSASPASVRRSVSAVTSGSAAGGTATLSSSPNGGGSGRSSSSSFGFSSSSSCSASAGPPDWALVPAVVCLLPPLGLSTRVSSVTTTVSLFPLSSPVSPNSVAFLSASAQPMFSAASPSTSAAYILVALSLSGT